MRSCWKDAIVLAATMPTAERDGRTMEMARLVAVILTSGQLMTFVDLRMSLLTLLLVFQVLYWHEMVRKLLVRRLVGRLELEEGPEHR